MNPSIKERLFAPAISTALAIGGIASAGIYDGVRPEPRIAVAEYTDDYVSVNPMPNTIEVAAGSMPQKVKAPARPRMEPTPLEEEEPELVLKEGVYCGPPLKDIFEKPEEVINILKEANITEVHPPCSSPYGRQGIAEGTLEAAPGVSLIRANQIMLELGKASGFKFYVDEPRFLSGDPALIKAASEDYKEYIQAGGKNFGIEMWDEMQPEQLNSVRPALEALRDFFKAQDLEITDFIRPNFAYTEALPEVIRTMVNIFGRNLKAGVDAYTTDPAVWDKIIGSMSQEGATVDDYMIAVPNSNWGNSNLGTKTEEPTAKKMAEYMKIVTERDIPAMSGFYHFTGFEAVPNIFGESFYGNLSNRKNLVMLLKARMDAGVGENNTFKRIRPTYPETFPVRLR